jgi:hypothetical protein
MDLLLPNPYIKFISYVLFHTLARNADFFHKTLLSKFSFAVASVSIVSECF